MQRKLTCLQGRVQFPTGGKVRERKLNRCDSGTDSTVWMKEDSRRPDSGMHEFPVSACLFSARRSFSGRSFFYCQVIHMKPSTLQLLQENLSFLGVSLALVAVILLAALGSEYLVMKKRHRLKKTRAITFIAMFSAIAAVLHIVDIAAVLRAVVLQARLQRASRHDLRVLHGPRRGRHVRVRENRAQASHQGHVDGLCRRSCKLPGWLLVRAARRHLLSGDAFQKGRNVSRSRSARRS